MQQQPRFAMLFDGFKQFGTAFLTSLLMTIFICLWWRFFGWMLLCILTCGIGFLWLMPYMTTSYARFYDDVRQAA